jgi:hypothetical protein
MRREDRAKQGLAVPPCILCIEKHHTAGRHHDPQLIDSLCEMHHREVHEQLRRAGVFLSYEPDNKKRVAMALRAIAVYDRARADAMERWAASLERPKKDRIKDQD